MGSLAFTLVREMPQPRLEIGSLPPGTMIADPYPGVGDRAEVVERRPRIVGHIESAHASTNASTGEFVLVFRLDPEGRRLFCHVTREHRGQRFAILLDNQVLTAPMINEEICGGIGQISGSFTAQSASELAIMLSAGALPAPLKVIQQGVGAYAPAGRG
jgi:preprotein translocase subunit SecD